MTIVALTVAATWCAVDDQVSRPPLPDPAVALGYHAFTCSCQLIVFAVVVYALSAHGGVRIVRTAATFGGIRAANRRLLLLRHIENGGRFDAPLSEPVDPAVNDDEDHRYTADRRHHRKIRSAAPLLQR